MERVISALKPLLEVRHLFWYNALPSKREISLFLSYPAKNGLIDYSGCGGVQYFSYILISVMKLLGT